MLRKTIMQRRNKERKGLIPSSVVIADESQFNTLKFIRTWSELKECTSKTHDLEIEDCCGWIKPKNKFEGKREYLKNKPSNKELLEHLAKYGTYLSTHTFYGGTHEFSTELLQKCGFNVVLANWDGIGM